MSTLYVNYRDDSSWEIKREGAQRASKTFDKKSEAVQEAERFLSEKEDIKKLIIRKKDGSVAKRKKITKENKVKAVSQDDKIHRKNLQSGNYILSYVAWKSDYQEKLTKKDIGKRVQIAGTSTTDKNYLLKVIQPGTSGWPDGGYIVRPKGVDIADSKHFYDEVILHKTEKQKKRAK